MKSLRVLLCTTFLYSYTYIQATAIGLLIGNIQFPSLNNAPMMRIYYEGKIIKTESQHNTLTYHIPKSRKQKKYFLLFVDVEHLNYITKEPESDILTQNTIDYLHTHPDVPYRIFEFIQQNDDTWIVRERLLPDNGRIPDSTIIVLYPSEHINKLEGGNKFQLPTIIMKDTITNFVHSEKELQEDATRRILASLDCDAIHATMKEHIKIAGNHVLVTPAT